MVLIIDRSAGKLDPRFGFFHHLMGKGVRTNFLGFSFYRYALSRNDTTFIWNGRRELLFALIKGVTGDGENQRGAIFSDVSLSRSDTNDLARWVGFGMSFRTLYNSFEQEAHRDR
jgi:hypothetical protein